MSLLLREFSIVIHAAWQWPKLLQMMQLLASVAWTEKRKTIQWRRLVDFFGFQRPIADSALLMLQDEFLAGCNELWGKRELRAVHKKLEKIGVEGVPDLLRENLSRCWNTLCFNAVVFQMILQNVGTCSCVVFVGG